MTSLLADSCQEGVGAAGLNRRFLSFFRQQNEIGAAQAASGARGRAASTASGSAETRNGITAVSAKGNAVAAPGVLTDAKGRATEINPAGNLVKLGFAQFDDEVHEFSPLRRRTPSAADLDADAAPAGSHQTANPHFPKNQGPSRSSSVSA